MLKDGISILIENYLTASSEFSNNFIFKQELFNWKLRRRERKQKSKVKYSVFGVLKKWLKFKNSKSCKISKDKFTKEL